MIEIKPGSDMKPCCMWNLMSHYRNDISNELFPSSIIWEEVGVMKH